MSTVLNRSFVGAWGFQQESVKGTRQGTGKAKPLLTPVWTCYEIVLLSHPAVAEAVCFA
jgi:hypothetical protein